MVKRRKSSTRNGSKRRHSYSDYRRLSPDENERQGHSRKARHYVLKSVKRVTSRTPSISARAHETLRTRQLHGLASPEIATKAREHGALTYRSEQARNTAQRNKEAAFVKKLHRQIEDAARRHERITEYAGPGERKPATKQVRKGRKSYSLRTGFQAKDWHASYVVDLRERKLSGEELDNGDWHIMMDYAERFKDPARHLLRASPGSFTIRGSVEDE
jgi:hypothetical protein